jgi:hypothetical protein
LVILGIGCATALPENPEWIPPAPDPQVDPYPFQNPDMGPRLGDGRDGTLYVSEPMMVNPCFGITSTTGHTVTLAAAVTAKPGDAFLLFQTQDEFAVSGPAATLSTPGDAGTWELAIVERIAGTNLTLLGYPSTQYSTLGGRTAQACLVPQYEDLQIQPSGSLQPQLWDGATGGIVAALVRGSLQLHGAIDVSGQGFRGGTTLGNKGCPLDLAAEAPWPMLAAVATPTMPAAAVAGTAVPEASAASSMRISAT